MPHARPALNLAAWRHTRTAVAKGARCAACGSRERIEVDHIVAPAAGGSDARSNLRPLCKHCNARKGNRPVTLAQLRAQAEPEGRTVYSRPVWPVLRGDYSNPKRRPR